MDQAIPLYSCICVVTVSALFSPFIISTKPVAAQEAIAASDWMPTIPMRDDADSGQAMMRGHHECWTAIDGNCGLSTCVQGSSSSALLHKAV